MEKDAMNSAARLLKLIEDTRRCGPTDQLRAVFAKILGLNPNDTPSLYRALSLIHDLITEIEEQVRRVPEINHDRYLRWVPNLKNVFSPLALTSSWQEYTSKFDRGDLIELGFCSDLLDRNHYQKEIPEESLQEILRQVNDLWARVLDEQIDPVVKSVILECLDRIRAAIRDYKIIGADALKDAIESGVGAVSLHAVPFKKGNNSEAVKRFGVILDLVDKAVSIATKSQALLPAVMVHWPLLMAAAAHVLSQ